MEEIIEEIIEENIEEGSFSELVFDDLEEDLVSDGSEGSSDPEETEEETTENIYLNYDDLREIIGSSDSGSDYSEYIYDYMVENNAFIVEEVPERTIFNTPLNEYTITEFLILLIVVFLLFSYFFKFVERNVFKWN